ncbi:MAG: hypothetical protein LBV23_00505 [Deltaproteobacteria bacterium]|jgi:hypothetical protein|nr:hypothetical protein [Deltaproteobacteria bacterium]
MRTFIQSLPTDPKKESLASRTPTFPFLSTSLSGGSLSSFLLCLLLIGLLLSYNASAADTFDPEEVKQLAEAGEKIDPNGNLNWESKPADPIDWTSINWTQPSGTKYVASIYIQSKDVSGSLVLTQFSNLTEIFVFFNQLTELNLSNNPQLTTVNAMYNQLTTLNLSNDSILSRVDARNNKLTELFLSNSPNLTYLNLSNNNLTGELDLTGFPIIQNLYVDNNQFTALKINNSYLQYLDVSNNRLTLSQLHPLMSLVDSAVSITLGNQTNVAIPALNASDLIPGTIYYLSTEATFGGTDTDFTFFVEGGVTANLGQDYSFNDNNKLTFLERGEFQIKMQNDNIHNSSSSSPSVVEAEVLKVRPPGAQLFWQGGLAATRGNGARVSRGADTKTSYMTTSPCVFLTEMRLLLTQMVIRQYPSILQE